MTAVSSQENSRWWCVSDSFCQRCVCLCTDIPELQYSTWHSSSPAEGHRCQSAWALAAARSLYAHSDWRGHCSVGCIYLEGCVHIFTNLSKTFFIRKYDRENWQQQLKVSICLKHQEGCSVSYSLPSLLQLFSLALYFISFVLIEFEFAPPINHLTLLIPRSLSLFWKHRCI